MNSEKWHFKLHHLKCKHFKLSRAGRKETKLEIGNIKTPLRKDKYYTNNALGLFSPMDTFPALISKLPCAAMCFRRINNDA